MAVRLSDLRAGRPLPSGRFLVLISVSQPQGHSSAGRIRLTEKSSDFMGNRTRDLPACNIVPQPTTLLRATSHTVCTQYIHSQGLKWFLRTRQKFHISIETRRNDHHILKKYIKMQALNFVSTCPVSLLERTVMTP
jgi:hypothetical protein